MPANITWYTTQLETMMWLMTGGQHKLTQEIFGKTCGKANVFGATWTCFPHSRSDSEIRIQ